MADCSTIEWTDASWNPITGCTKVSPGCDHCYAETFAERWRGISGHPYEQGFDVRLWPDRLELPLRWRRPRRVFVNSMSDLFHDKVPDKFIADVFAVMRMADQHSFQVLTKRHGRLRSLLNSNDFRGLYNASLVRRAPGLAFGVWPVPNVWLGVSVEDQRWADIRIPALLDTPAAVRWLSCEPLLGLIDLAPDDHTGHARDWQGTHYECLDCSTDDENGWVRWTTQEMPPINWVVAGGESGPGARPVDVAWIRLLRNRCVANSVPFFFKQWGEWVPPSHMPADTFMSWDCEHGTSAYDRDQPWRVGKKRAGRELDGRTWDQYPQPLLTAARHTGGA